MIEIRTSGENLNFISDSLKNAKFWTDKWFNKCFIETEIWFDDKFTYGSGYNRLDKVIYKYFSTTPDKILLQQYETTISLWDNILSIQESSYIFK
jgi:hypothetical protein